MPEPCAERRRGLMSSAMCNTGRVDLPVIMQTKLTLTPVRTAMKVKYILSAFLVGKSPQRALKAQLAGRSIPRMTTPRIPRSLP